MNEWELRWCHLWLLAINCWKMVVLVHYETQQTKTKYTSLACHSCPRVLAVCLSFKSQCVDLFCGMVYGYAANPRYSFCEVILQVRLYSRTHSKLDRTLKQNCNTNDFPKHLWLLATAPLKPARNNASQKDQSRHHHSQPVPGRLCWEMRIIEAFEAQLWGWLCAQCLWKWQWNTITVIIMIYTLHFTQIFALQFVFNISKV